MNTAKAFNTPILFLIFNRLEQTKQVFEVIRTIKPYYLFVAADGPRNSVASDAEKCRLTREIITQVDWPCEIKTLFRADNLGCGRAVSSAITWFFEQVEEGIILEDDCLPHPSFFNYCAELLDYYRDNPKIMHIAGFNPLGITDCNGESYYFSTLQHCWGWATWRRAWQKYNFKIDDHLALDYVKIFPYNELRNYWREIFAKMEQMLVDTWDYQWTYAILRENGLCINPAKNLVSNVGFHHAATHTKDSGGQFANLPVYAMSTLIHPRTISLNRKLLSMIYKSCCNVYPKNHELVIRVIRKLIKIFGFDRRKSDEM